LRPEYRSIVDNEIFSRIDCNAWNDVDHGVVWILHVVPFVLPPYSGLLRQIEWEENLSFIDGKVKRGLVYLWTGGVWNSGHALCLT
jgi:hypothetical protein